MSKRGYISRYMSIIKKLESKSYSTFEEIQVYIEREFERNDDNSTGFSKRTFQRDIREIGSLFQVEIKYSKAEKGYFINTEESEMSNFQQIMESFDIFNSLNYAKGATPYIYLENRKPKGTENLYGIIHALKNNYLVRFTYHKYWEDIVTERELRPLGLKEFKNRWYLLASETGDSQTKSFALDRISNLEISSVQFKRQNNVNIEEYFRNCFGIISPNGEAPQEILLSFTPFQGKYIKSLPLHESQKIVLETESELQISLKLCLTLDLEMELLSFGDNVKVLSPESLKLKLLEKYQNAINQY